MLTVSISGYRAWRRGGTPGSTRLADPQAATLMKDIHAEVKAPTALGACIANSRAAGTASDLLAWNG